MKKIILFIMGLTLLIMVVGCNMNNAIKVSDLTNTPFLTQTPIKSPTPEVTRTFASSPTPTLVQYQSLGPIFPEGYTGDGVAANIGSGITPVAGHHFDIGIPNGFPVGVDADEYVIFPARGYIERMEADVSGTGTEVFVRPEPKLQGIEELLTRYGYNPELMMTHWYIFNHIDPLDYGLGDHVMKGQPAGTVFDRMRLQGQWSNIVAFRIRAKMKDKSGEIYIVDFFPCDLQPDLSFCGVCYPGTAELKNPCP